MGFPRFAVVNAIKSPVTLSKHLKRKLSYQVGEKVSWILKRHSVNIISCIYAAQGIGQDPVVCILQAFKTRQAHRHGCPIYEALCVPDVTQGTGQLLKEPEYIFAWKKYLVLGDMVLCCRDHLNANDSPKGRSDPALSLERLSHSPSPPSSVHVEAEETQELLILPPHLFPAHPHISVVASWPVPQAGTSWTLLFSVSLTHPAHQEALRTQWPKRKKTAFPFPPFWMLATAQVFKPSSFRTQATATPSKLALREGHSYLQQGPPQATVLAGWQLSLPALCSLRHKMQILHGGPHSPQEPWLLSAPLLSEAPLATVLSISLGKNSGLHSSCTLWPCLLGKVLPQIGGRALVFWLRSEFLCWLSARVSHSAVSDSLWPHRL